jgi:hypothetical protein
LEDFSGAEKLKKRLITVATFSVLALSGIISGVFSFFTNLTLGKICKNKKKRKAKSSIFWMI